MAIKAFHPDATPFSDVLIDETTQIKDLVKQQLVGSTNIEQRLQAIEARLPRTQITSTDIQSPDDSVDKHINEEIDRYRDLIENGKPKTAIGLLTALKTKLGDISSPKTRFRILGNIAAAHHRLGEYEAAADYFLEAAPLNPDEPVSLANQIAALLIKKRLGEAHALAVRAFDHYPDREEIAVQRLQARGADESFEDIWASLSAAIAAKASLILLRITILRADNKIEWREIAQQSLTTHPDEPDLKIIRAESVIDRVLAVDPTILGVGQQGAPSSDEIAAAAVVLETAWNGSLNQEAPPIGSYAHNAALAFNVLGDSEKAAHLLDAAIAANVALEESKRFRVSLFARAGNFLC